LQSGHQYSVQAGGFIPYRVELDGIWTGTAAFETNILSHIAPKEIEAHIPVQFKEKYILQACADPTLMQKLNTSIPLAGALAKKAAENTASGKNKDAFFAYFKVDNAENRKKVADRYTAMYKTLTDKSGPTKISCRAECTGYYSKGLAWTSVIGGSTEICPGMKTFPADLKKCNRMNWPGVLLHELSHSATLFRPSTNQ
jgi:hypothetical protein